MAHKPTREEAWTILTDHVKNPSLLSHALAVEAVMRHVARTKGADEELWGVIGLIHDVDYEEHPDEHLRVLIADTIEGMKPIAETIGLKGNPSGSPST